MKQTQLLNPTYTLMLEDYNNYNLTAHHFLYCDKQETAQQGFPVEVPDWWGTLT